MKILIPHNNWPGGTLDFVARALRNLGHDVILSYPTPRNKIAPIGKRLKLDEFVRYNKWLNEKWFNEWDKNIYKDILEYKPDIFFSLNSRINPLIFRKISKIKNLIKVCWIQDNPFDSTRFSFFPYNLEYFDFLFLADKTWAQNIKNLAPHTPMDFLVGAYDPDQFLPVSLTQEEEEQYRSEIAFAGSTYGTKAEGVYRVGILSKLQEYKLKIWGDGWNNVFDFYPGLKSFYQGNRLNFNQLNKMYQGTIINLNLPNPQLYKTFQQRVFEIAGAKGFQIVDYREDIEDYFSNDEMVTFKNIDELKEKLNFFLRYPEKRNSYIEKSYNKTVNKHTYKIRMNEMLTRLLNN